MKLFLLFVFVLFARPQDFFPLLKPLRLAFVMTIIIIIVTVVRNKFNGIQYILKFKQVKKIIVIYIIMIIGIPFSMHRGYSFDFVFMRYSMQIIFFIFSIIYVDSIEKFEKFLFIVCLSGFFYACFSLINAGSFSGRFAYGSMYDPNDLAAFLVMLIPLKLYFLSSRGVVGQKVVAITAIGISIIVILMTGSRGGLLGLAAVLFLLFFTKLSLLKHFHKVVLLGIFVAAIGANYEKINIDRYSSLFNMEDDYNVTSETGRFAIWKRGGTLTLANPLTGVGTRCFGMAIGYDRKKDGEIPRWQTAHNSYILFLTEVGIIGFTVYLSMIFNSLKIFYNYSKEETLPEKFRSITNMSKVILLAFIGHLICASFLSHAYSGGFTLFFAFSVILQRVVSFEEKYSNLSQSEAFGGSDSKCQFK